MVRIVALHKKPADPEEYLRYYRDVHTPLVRALPGVQEIRFGRVTAMPDGGDPPYFLTSEVYFSSQADLELAAASPEMERCLSDVGNFSRPGDVTIMWAEGIDATTTTIEATS
jgi:uncharacterized protein (TIGR02118 family)